MDKIFRVFLGTGLLADVYVEQSRYMSVADGPEDDNASLASDYSQVGNDMKKVLDSRAYGKSTYRDSAPV